MANNYTQSSSSLRFPSPEARELFLSIAEAVEERFEENELTEEQEKLLVDVYGEDQARGFDNKFAEDVDGDGDREVFVSSEDYLDPELIATACKYVLGKHPGAPVGMAWAFTCDKPRLDEFGGGAFVATAEQVEWLDTSQWLSLKLQG